jgi:site-specific recombinase XerD
MLPFVASQTKKSIDHLAVEDISPHAVRAFLAHLESDRGCSAATRNQRLAAIHAIARFIGQQSPEHIAWCAEVRAIPFKKTGKPSIPYLEKPEMDALLEAPDRSTAVGYRDYSVLLFLYNTGARADEAARLLIGDLTPGSSPSVKILGKGRKTRHCPLWPLTVKVLGPLLAGRAPHEPLFRNRRSQPITRFGIYELVTRHAAKAGTKIPSLGSKRISPHTIRHTTAVHLLRAGVDLNTIRGWLGHVSLNTTNIYAEVDLAMKAKALTHCEVDGPAARRAWREDRGVMAFLKAL